jgi:hypothetical protein
MGNVANILEFHAFSVIIKEASLTQKQDQHDHRNVM